MWKEIPHSVREITSLKVFKKQNINKRSLKFLKICKKHGGPLSSSNADMKMMNKLDTAQPQLLAVVCHLRTTIAPNIKEKRRIKSDDKIFLRMFPKLSNVNK